MEDILAFIIVLAVAGLIIWIGVKLYSRIKEERQKKAIREEADRVRYSPKQWAPVTPQQYADVIPKRKPAMKKANVSSSYANTPMTSTSSTSTTGTLDIGDVITGALVLNELFGHKTGGSDPIDFPKSSSSWGLDDSDSRKSISDSMDTSSSWSSSDFGSSDSGPSSDW